MSSGNLNTTEEEGPPFGLDPEAYWNVPLKGGIAR
jgi:hypothetical protein